MIEIDMKKFTIAIIVVLIMWCSLAFVLIKYGEAVTRDPCKVCADRLGDGVTCNKFIAGEQPISKTFYPSNYSYPIGVFNGTN